VPGFAGVPIIISSPHPQPKSKSNALLRTADGVEGATRIVLISVNLALRTAPPVDFSRSAAPCISTYIMARPLVNGRLGTLRTTGTQVRTKGNMRSTVDLIGAFRRWARWVDKVALVVGFEAETKFVRNSDPDPLSKLDVLLKAGGRPVGMIGFVNDFWEADVWRSYWKPLEEYAGQEWVKPYLEMFIHVVFEINRMENGYAWLN
jgi:hypothetical protein